MFANANAPRVTATNPEADDDHYREWSARKSATGSINYQPALGQLADHNGGIHYERLSSDSKKEYRQVDYLQPLQEVHHMANYDNRKSYNNQPLREGETMIPIFISDWEMVRTYNMDRNNMETWRVGGQKITVAFTPARIEQKDTLMHLFWNEVREYIKEQVHADQHLSYEELTEWNDDEENPKRFDPGASPSLEETVLLRMAIDELIEEVRAVDPIYGIVLDLVKEGYERKEIVKRLNLSQSQAYKKISEAHAKAKELYFR